MELNSQINTFSKGMDMDTDITMLSEGQYRYAENVRLLTDSNGTTGVLQNIEYIRQYEGNIPQDEIILGTSTARLYDDNSNGTIECGIVLTKKTVNNKPYNILYKVLGFESKAIRSIVVVQGYLGIENNVSIVTNYESDGISNVYICDGLTPIKVINICDTFDDIVIDNTKFDITPGVTLLPFTLESTINGALPAGAVQYCYQLFNLHGPETTTSALSEVIPITKYDTAGTSSKVIGQMKGELSGRGCKISAKFKNDGRFDRARIFSIIYLDNISIPDIYIINEVEIPNNKANELIEFTYNDTGVSFLSKITIDEFNAMVPFEFNAKSIEKMNNRLFASNTQELTWDVDYDARAYRCDSNGRIVLNSSDNSQHVTGTLNADGTISSSNNIVVNGMMPEKHDCINPSNQDVLSNNVYQYGYVGNTKVRGGTGPNVSYRFVFTELVLSSKDSADGDVSGTLDLTAQSLSGGNTINTFYEDGTICKSQTIKSDNKVIPNYADPYMCANYLGYQRDEIYRFGVIFYNNKNIPSPVHWIGDIRMPSTNDTSDLTSKLHSFHVGEWSTEYNKTVEMLSYALGIEFTLKNIPADVFSYEIVRCDRNEKDRTIVTQGIVGALFKFTDWSNGKEDSTGEFGLGPNDVRPAPMFNLASNFRTYFMHHEADIDYWHTASPGYFEFVSPEVCISKDLMFQHIQNNQLCPLYKTYSTYNARTTIPQEYLYTTAEDENVTNDPDFGKVKSVDGVIYFNAGWGRGYEDDNVYGYAGVFKYYKKLSYDNSVKHLSIEDGIISNTLPYFNTLKDAKNHVQFIGNKSYVNVSIGGYRQFSNHGINAVIQVDSTYNPYKDPTGVSDFCTAIIANVKQQTIPYGGDTYISRQNSVYVSCGCFTSDFTSKVMCYGGDTYLGVFDYLNTSVIQSYNDSEKEKWNRLCCVCYIPLESVVNVNLRSDDSYHRNANGRQGQNMVQNEPTSLPNGYVQKKPYYEYNPVYSTTSGAKQYVPKSIYSIDNQINQNRIVSSELKTNNEVTDSWCKFKFANYIDVDSQYGQITNLKTFNNKLIYWQDNAVGIAAVNERSLITDNNAAELTLGTGGILTRYDYVSILNGSSIVNDKSIVNSSTSLYWYDFDKNEICVLGQTTTAISKLKGVQSYLNTLPRTAKQNAVSFYDKKFNEVWFRIYDKALIYNEQLQSFTSFYTHNPNWFFPFSDKLVTIKNNNMYYLHNIYEVNSNIKEERIAKVEFVVNKDVSNTKVFDNVIFSAELENKDVSTSPMIKDIVFKTKTQETSALTIDDIDLREDNYRFAIPREKVSDEELHQLDSKSYLGRMRGKYLICDYTFDCNNNREFKLPYIKTTYRYSML